MSDSDDDVGPMPMPAEALDDRPRKKQKRKHSDALVHERIYLDQLPCTELYEMSYMHRDVLSYTGVSNRTEFIITTSVDGHLKFWKKSDNGIEFVKHFRAHLGEVCGMSINSQGTLLATISPTKELKIFDIVNFDMINMLSLDFVPATVAWTFQPGQPLTMVAVSDADSGSIFLFDAQSAETKPLHTVTLHRDPVVVMKYNERYDCVVSIDATGMIEYWSPSPPFDVPSSVTWSFKSDTDLYEYRKLKAAPSSLDFSRDGQFFVTYGLVDRQVRVWRFLTGKLFRKYDESLQAQSEMQQAGTAITRLDDMEFGRRLAVERDLEANAHARKYANAIFDASGTFVLYATLLGIKVVNIHANRVSKLIGAAESHRFLHLSLYQGAPRKKKVVTLAMASSENPNLQDAGAIDPTLFATAYKKNRFFLFTRRDPAEAAANDGDAALLAVSRDVFNEKPSKEEQTMAMLKSAGAGGGARAARPQATQATVHTTMGDLVLDLYPDHAPKTVENFVTHARNQYYNNVLVHRVIESFMIQTGDPKGNGTGGESIWGGEFEDEIVPGLKHDRPGVLSMANAGKDTNGSQFFITTAPTPWLDGKHTIFGRLTGGMDVLRAIERTPTDKDDRPLKDIHIVSITIK
ncbi:hypothetical protein GGF32_000040 [Allomyces javanicus]|nr:hypothetical protein GGF32_000040 [Allomyces javanicus]